MESLKGQVVRKKCSSKKLVFVDIKTSKNEIFKVIFKLGICNQSVLDRLKRGEEKIHLGDFIELQGKLRLIDLRVRRGAYG